MEGAEVPANREDLKRQNPVKHFVAGAMARCTSATLMFPLDTVKTRIQFQSNASYITKRYSNAIDTLVRIGKEEGLRAYFRGLPIRLFYVAPAAAVSFSLYEEFKYLFRWNLKTGTDLHSFNIYNALIPLTAGALARLFGTACRTPFDMVKQRLQVQGSLKEIQYKSSMEAIVKIFRTEGLAALWTGYIPTLFRDVPFAALYFTTYETAKLVQYRLLYHGERRLTTVNHLLAGGLAGSLASCLTIPFDVVKTRLQTQNSLPPEERIYRGVLPTLIRIFREEGLNGITKGLGPRLIYVVPASSLTFACYENYKILLNSLFPS